MSCWKILETERRSWKFSLASGNFSLELNGLEMHEKCAFLSLVSCVDVKLLIQLIIWLKMVKQSAGKSCELPREMKLKFVVVSGFFFFLEYNGWICLKNVVLSLVRYLVVKHLNGWLYCNKK